VLQRTGHAATAVENGLAGFAEVQNQPFDAIVSDFLLPFLGGSNFHQRSKKVSPHRPLESCL
jgi:CheY-like chemotaxis protein